jgi:hypothetical protein
MFNFGMVLSRFGVFRRDEADTGLNSPARHSAQLSSDLLSDKVLADAARRFGT